MQLHDKNLRQPYRELLCWDDPLELSCFEAKGLSFSILMSTSHWIQVEALFVDERNSKRGIHLRAISCQYP